MTTRNIIQDLGFFYHQEARLEHLVREQEQLAGGGSAEHIHPHEHYAANKDPDKGNDFGYETDLKEFETYKPNFQGRVRLDRMPACLAVRLIRLENR